MMLEALKSKTMVASYLLILLGFAEENFRLFADAIPELYQPLALSGIGFLIAIVRLVLAKAALNK